MIHCRTLLTGVLATLLTTGLASAAQTELPESRNDKFEKGYPHQFESWASTSEMDFKSKHLGSKMEDMLEKDPRLVVLWAGYGFSKDYNAPRGHAYAITDLRNTTANRCSQESDRRPNAECLLDL